MLPIRLCLHFNTCLDKSRFGYHKVAHPPHYGRNVRQYLINTFPRICIGLKGAMEWPAISPDLNPLNYFFWGRMNNLVYQTKPIDIQNLHEKLLEKAQLISRVSISNAVSAFYTRLAHCQTAGVACWLLAGSNKQRGQCVERRDG
ncbi:hypothetical protein J6590_030597 [Homalodisca vitripennis]|nr:hypothetical protein J6590_030597 [Homalodisca vitripennis]